MTEENLINSLKKKTNQDFSFEIVENTSTILQIKSSPEGIKKVKIHKCFIHAPEEVIDLLAQYIKGNRKKLQRKKLVMFARKTLSCKPQKKTKIEHTGKFYDLKSIFDSLNEKYFNNSITSQITFGKRNKKERNRSIVFGNYNPQKNIIRINRALDNSYVPDFFIRYIVFHEMLHAYLFLNGERFHSHSRTFKKMEKLYPEHKIAENWKRENLSFFIKGKTNVQQTQ